MTPRSWCGRSASAAAVARWVAVASPSLNAQRQNEVRVAPLRAGSPGAQLTNRGAVYRPIVGVTPDAWLLRQHALDL